MPPGRPHRRERTVSYTNLDGGRYTLQVRAANADGVWNERGLDIPFEVTPPPWKSAPGPMRAMSVALGLLGWLAWLAHRRSIMREVRYSQKLEAEVRRRTLELEQLSFTDALTGLGNRRALTDAMPRVLAEARARPPGTDDHGSRQSQAHQR